MTRKRPPDVRIKRPIKEYPKFVFDDSKVRLVDRKKGEPEKTVFEMDMPEKVRLRIEEIESIARERDLAGIPCEPRKE